MVTTTPEIIEHPILFTGEMVRAILDGRKTQTRRVITDCGRYAGWTHAQKMLPDFADEFPGAGEHGWVLQKEPGPIRDMEYQPIGCGPYGVPGHRLWVRETWLPSYQNATWEGVWYPADGGLIEVEHGKLPPSATLANAGRFMRRTPEQTLARIKDSGIKLLPSIHMPRWACRLLLEVTEVRVQRVQEISEDDAVAEGVKHCVRDLATCADGSVDSCEEVAMSLDSRRAFAALWDSINAKRGYSWESNPWVWAVTFKRLTADQADTQVKP